jgi:hypothetical protein
LAEWIARRAGGASNGAGGSNSGAPDTVDMVMRSPLSIVATGASRASKYPQCTVSGPASNRRTSALPSINLL